MTLDIGTRELISVSACGADIRGTYHKVLSGDRTAFSAETNSDKIGLIFLNGGYRPRSGEGDTGVYWADSLAGSGYPCFRFDLPGYGDSTGEVPAKLFDWLHLINTGVYGRIVANLTRAIIARFHLDGAVLIGHCAGATSAIYAASATADIKGLVLLDPYFHCERENTRARLRVREWVTRNKVAGLLREGYQRLKYLDRLLERDELPGNANVQVIRRCEQLIARKIPILVLKAPALNARLADFDYPGYLRGICGIDSPLTVELIAGTNHSFAKGPGKAKVRERIELWLGANFSGAGCREVVWNLQSALR